MSFLNTTSLSQVFYLSHEAMHWLCFEIKKNRHKLLNLSFNKFIVLILFLFYYLHWFLKNDKTFILFFNNYFHVLKVPLSIKPVILKPDRFTILWIHISYHSSKSSSRISNPYIYGRSNIKSGRNCIYSILTAVLNSDQSIKQLNITGY